MKRIYREFQSRSDDSIILVRTAHQVKRNGTYVRSILERSSLTEYAYLKYFIAWESFLEKSFLAYLMGIKSTSGSIINRRFAPQDLEHAYQILSGSSPFIDWSLPSNTSRLAGIAFDGNDPFSTVIPSLSRTLEDSKIIRNSIAHISTSTAKKLESLANRVLRKPSAGINPYEFLLSDITDALGNPITVFESYTSQIDIGAELIARA